MRIRRPSRSLSSALRPARPDWDSEVASGLALAGFLSLVFVGFTLLAMGPLVAIDAYFNLSPPPPAWVPVLHLLDRIGQRLVCMPILTVAVLLACRRQRSWRPAALAALSTFTLNCVVGALKLGFGRAEPRTGDPHFFSGGIAYPSGHTANIVLVYGLAVYLLARYNHLRRRTQLIAWSVVATLSVVMVVVSMQENWHWFADLIAGLLVGGVMLQLTVVADAAVPLNVFRAGWREGLRRIWLALRGRAPAPAPGPVEVPRERVLVADPPGEHVG
ncbi:MAG TPA: phosphatase PAP2 family protein [Nocardioidaceae bacterium]|nr:phosphatase PAP2 family protein [Nocardioidaceae bacterium]